MLLQQASIRAHVGELREEREKARRLKEARGGNRCEMDVVIAEGGGGEKRDARRQMRTMAELVVEWEEAIYNIEE